MNQCTVENCDRTIRSSGALYCEMHYYRLRRTGTTAERPRAAVTCSAEDCGLAARGNGLCAKHYARMRRYGSTELPHRPDKRDFSPGARNVRWTGDAVSYFGMHQRLHRIKGRASDHPCEECGTPAKQWSYDRTDPDERQSDEGPYSVSPEHYVARCTSCHKKFDLASKSTRPGKPIDLDLIRHLHGQGVRLRAIAKQLGVSRDRVQRAFDELGLPRFRPGNPHVVRYAHQVAPDGSGVLMYLDDDGGIGPDAPIRGVP